MTIFHVVLLAVIQGLTEFLPISSSGHLVLFQSLLGFNQPELLLDISLHIGTLLAICLVFFKDIRSVITSIIKFPALLHSAGGFRNLFSENTDIRMLILIIAGSFPTAIIGLLFHKIAGQIFSSVPIVGVMLLLTGTFLWASRFTKKRGHKIKQVNIKDVLIIGLVQGLAVLPGISRSGSTIVAGLFAGVERETAARFSFLLSIPAILGALILELTENGLHTSVSFETILLGILISAIVGFAALKILMSIVKHGKLYFFAPYCWALGLLTLIVG